MTPEERKSLAEQITTNPLFQQVMDDLEKSAIERLIYEKKDALEAQLRVQAIRSLVEDIKMCLNVKDKRASPP